MVVVFAKYLPDAIRGIMKIWFIEIRANVFISGINDSTANKVIQHLMEQCPIESGLIIVQSSNLPPFYKLSIKGADFQKIVEYNGLQLIREFKKSENP